MSAPTPPETSEGDVDTSGPSLRLVFGIIGVLVVCLGITAYWRYTVSENWFATSLPKLSETGEHVDTEGCVDAVLRWYDNCAANKALCDNGVPRAMTHCLMAADRAPTCEELGDRPAKAQWVFKSCLDRGTPCKSRKKCACANAYRALDSFCRHDQKGVAL
ncbi:MAG: hypothetical protein JKY37_14540 [Nannocystaceae bacterium]|nr:hypothetical protein [Nannocystaceae bacterium]